MAKIQKPEQDETESSSGEYESGSSSEVESEPEILQIQTTKSESKVPKSVDVAPKANIGAKNPVSEPTQAVTPAKRRATEEEPKDGKKQQVELDAQNTPGASKSSKKNPFLRVWSDSDEIVILQGVLEYAEVKNSTPSANMDAFLEFIKKDLQYDGNKNQLRDKIGKLKKRYNNSKKKYEENKLKDHDLKAFELCHKIWEDGVVLEAAKANVSEGSKSMKKNRSFENDQVENKVNATEIGGNMDVANVDADLLRVGNGNAGRNKWNKLLIEELELGLKAMDVERAQLDLRQSCAKMRLESMKSKENH